MIFDELFKICCENKWNVSLCTKNSKDTELAYRAKLINGNWKFLCNKNVSSAYKAINEHDLIIFTNSTLGLEALIKRKKCISFPPDFFPYKNFNLIYPKEGPFWSCSFSREKLLELISNVENFDNNEWNIIIKKYIERIMAFDSKNKTFLKFLKQHKISTKI